MKLSTRSDVEPAAVTTELVKLLVRPIPDMSPPIIDSRTAMFQDPSPFIQGTLAIDFRGDYDTPEDPEGPEYFGPQRALSRDLPEPEAWVRHIAQALVEVMSGARPAPQVIRWRICEPVDGVVEACAVVVDNGRVRALAMRLTGVDRRWVVSELQVG